MPVYAANVEAAVSVVVEVLIVMEAPAATVMLRVDVPVVCASMFGTEASASITTATKGVLKSANGAAARCQCEKELAGPFAGAAATATVVRLLLKRKPGFMLY